MLSSLLSQSPSERLADMWTSTLKGRYEEVFEALSQRWQNETTQWMETYHLLSVKGEKMPVLEKIW